MADKKTLKEKVKSWNKKLNKYAKDYHLGRPFMKLKKPEKKKDYVTNPDATFGGKRIQIKDGPEIKVRNAQEDLSKIKRMKRPEEYKAKGGRVGVAKRGFNKKILRKD